MKARKTWSRILVVVGGIAMLAGALDPLEGSVVILAGSALVALGTYLGGTGRSLLFYWIWVLLLIAVGVGAMFGLSAIGGFGGSSGRSMLWGVPILPYPVGWIMGIVSLSIRLIKSFRHSHVVA
jgi:purine-cytosine permease-like protein